MKYAKLLTIMLGLAVIATARAHAGGELDKLRSTAESRNFNSVADGNSQRGGNPVANASFSTQKAPTAPEGKETGGISNQAPAGFNDEASGQAGAGNGSTGNKGGFGIKTGSMKDFLMGGLFGAGGAWLLGAMGIGMFGGPMGLLLGAGIGMLLMGVVMPSLRGGDE